MVLISAGAFEFKPDLKSESQIKPDLKSNIEISFQTNILFDFFDIKHCV